MSTETFVYRNNRAHCYRTFGKGSSSLPNFLHDLHIISQSPVNFVWIPHNNIGPRANTAFFLCLAGKLSNAFFQDLCELCRNFRINFGSFQVFQRSMETFGSRLVFLQLDVALANLVVESVVSLLVSVLQRHLKVTYRVLPSPERHQSVSPEMRRLVTLELGQFRHTELTCGNRPERCSPSGSSGRRC